MFRRIFIAILLLWAASARATVPSTLNYQGRIKLSGGATVPDGTGNTLVFNIYTAGGTSLWNETWNSATSCVTTTAGLFNVVLGSFSSLGALPFDQPYLLGIAVNGDPEMTPRQPLTSSPYAFHAKIADSAGVFAPLTLTATASAAVLTLQQGGAGAALSASAAGNNSIGIYGTSSDPNGMAIKAEAASTNAAMSVSNFGNGRGLSAGAGNAEAVYGIGRTGVAGVAIPNAVGVVASDGGNNSSQALKVLGGGSFSGGNVTFSGQVDFSGATVTGWNLPVNLVAPLTVTANFGGSAFTGINNGTGSGLLGVAGSNGTAVIGQAASGVGISGQSTSNNGVLGQSTSGIGVQGIGQTGTAGSPGAPGGVGVFASDGSLANSLALRVKGNSLFGPGSVSFSSHVDFSGATITGWSVPAVVNAPLSLSLGSPVLAPLYTNNSGSGPGLSVTAANGTGLMVGSGSGIGLQAQGYSYGAVIQGSSILPTVVGLSGTANNVNASGISAIGVYGNALGTGAVNKFGTYGEGGTGTGAYGNGGTGVYGNGTNYGVYGNGGTSYGVWGQSSGGSAAIGGVNGSNTSGGPGVYGTSSTGPGVYGTGNLTNEGVKGDSNGSSAAIHGTSFSSGPGVKGQSNAGIGVIGSAGGLGTYGVEGQTVAGGYAGVHGWDVSGLTTSSGVFGQSATGIGVLGSGLTGTAGSAGAAGGIGVLAGDGGQTNALALRVKGNAFFSPGSVTFSSHVDFSGATITGWTLPATIAVPLSVTGALPGAVISSYNSGSGPGIEADGASVGISATAAFGVAVYGRNNGGGGFIPAGLFEVQGTNHAVEGRNTANGAIGALGGDLNNGSTGVYGQATANNAKGVWGQSGSGDGVYGSGLTGVAGVVTSPGQVGVLADSQAFSNSLALQVKGPARFSNGPVTFSAAVDFSGATITGWTLPTTVAVPLTLTGSVGFPGAVAQAGNLGSGFGLMGSATGSGAIAGTGTSGVGFSDSLTAGVYGASSGSISAGVLGRNFDATQNNVGVMGLSLNGSGIYGESYGVGGTGGQFLSLSGTALQAQGLNGISAQTLSTGGTAISADTNNNLDRTALAVRGPANFNSYTSGSLTSAVVFNSPVQFNGTVTGINGLGSVPFVISGASPSPALQVTNTNTGNGDAASFSSYQGNGVDIQSANIGVQLTVSNSSGTNAFGITGNISSTAAGGQIWGSNMNVNTYGSNANATGHYVTVQTTGSNAQATGIFAYASATAAGVTGVHGEAHVQAGNFGVGVDGQTDSASGYGVNANNSNAGGVGLFASGGQYSIRLGKTMDANANHISNLLDPIGSNDAATKNYVDTHGGSVPNPLVLTNNPGSAVIEGQNLGAGIGVQGISGGIGVDAQGAIGMQAMGSNFGLSVTASNGNFYGVYALNTGVGTGAALYGQMASSTGSGVYGINQASSGAAVGVLGQSNSNTGYGVEGSASSATGVYGNGATGVLAVGSNLALSATASGFSATAIYGRVSSSQPAAVFTNDNAGGTPLQINNMKFPATDSGFGGEFLTTNGSGTLSFANPTVSAPLNLSGSNVSGIITATNSGTGPAVQGTAANSGPGVEGVANTSQGIGLRAVQASSAATLTNGGVALQVSGPVKVDSWTTAVESDSSYNSNVFSMSQARSSGSIVFPNGKGGIVTYNVTDPNFVGTNSVVLVSFSGIASVGIPYAVVTQNSSLFSVSFSNSVSITAGSQMNFIVIRQ